MNADLAEQSLLGTALMFPKAAPAVLDDLELADVGDPTVRQVYVAMRRLMARRVQPDAPLVVAELHRNGVPAPSGRGWPVVVSDLTGQALTPAHGLELRRAVLEQAMRRHADEAMTRVRQAAHEGSMRDVDRALRDGLATLGRTVARLAAVQPRSGGEAA